MIRAELAVAAIALVASGAVASAQAQTQRPTLSLPNNLSTKLATSARACTELTASPPHRHNPARNTGIVSAWKLDQLPSMHQ